MQLELLPQSFAICRLEAGAAIPDWATASPVFCVTRTYDELSVVCEAARAPSAVQQEGPWRALKVRGPLDFALTGILASLADPLAERRISLFAISTFDTDYLLVRSEKLDHACAALRSAGHLIFG